MNGLIFALLAAVVIWAVIRIIFPSREDRIEEIREKYNNKRYFS